MAGLRRFDDILIHTENQTETKMSELNGLAWTAPTSTFDNIQLPVAYSWGGFAQSRQVVASDNSNPLGPLPVPAELEALIAADSLGIIATEQALAR